MKIKGYKVRHNFDFDKWEEWTNESKEELTDPSTWRFPNPNRTEKMVYFDDEVMIFEYPYPVSEHYLKTFYPEILDSEEYELIIE